MPLTHTDNAEPRNSPELDEVISKPPPALIGLGIGTMTVIVITLILIAAYVQYPTLVNAPKMTLQVAKDNRLTAQLMIPERSISKIQKRQPVFISLTAYPAGNYGQLLGSVESVGNIQKDGNIAVLVAVASSTSDAGEKLPVINGMTGDARIMTDKTSLLRRMYVQLLHVNLSK
jgi:hypothetical protein